MQQLEAARCKASASWSNLAKVRDGLNCSREKEGGVESVVCLVARSEEEE